jgi:hypothetical protein
MQAGALKTAGGAHSKREKSKQAHRFLIQAKLFTIF